MGSPGDPGAAGEPGAPGLPGAPATVTSYEAPGGTPGQAGKNFSLLKQNSLLSHDNVDDNDSY